MALSKSEAKKAAEDSAAEEESKYLATEAAGEGEKSYEGVSEGYVVQNLDAEAVRQLRTGLGFCIVLSALLLCCSVGWFVSYWLAGSYHLDRISGSYRLDWIGSYRLDEDT